MAEQEVVDPVVNAAYRFARAAEQADPERAAAWTRLAWVLEQTCPCHKAVILRNLEATVDLIEMREAIAEGRHICPPRL